jgi:hypothetical protein
MKHLSEEVRFEEYLQEVNGALQKLADHIIQDIRETSGTYEGQIPEEALTAYWERLAGTDVWEKLREDAIGIFMDRLSESYPEGLKYLAKKVALSRAPQNGNGAGAE